MGRKKTEKNPKEQERGEQSANEQKSKDREPKKMMNEAVWVYVSLSLMLLLCLCITVSVLCGMGTYELAVRGELFPQPQQQEELLDEMQKEWLKEQEELAKANEGEVQRYKLQGNICKRIMLYYLSKQMQPLEEFCQGNDVWYNIYSSTGKKLAGNIPEGLEQYASTFVFTEDALLSPFKASNYRLKILWKESRYIGADGVKTQTTINRFYQFCGKHRGMILLGLILSAALALTIFLLLMVMVTRRGRQIKSLLSLLPVELILAAAFLGLRAMGRGIEFVIPEENEKLLAMIGRGNIFVLIALLTFFHVIRRVQMQGWYRDSLIYYSIRFFRTQARLYGEVFHSRRMVRTTEGILLVLSLMELGALVYFLPPDQPFTLMLLLVWALEKVLVTPWLLYLSVVVGKLSLATHEVVSGNLDYQVKMPRRVPRALKDFSQDINALADSISVAVDERMKSEHLKTELITNVSHDIKTPLTSIINFSDLIVKEKSENPKIAEYADHLYKQSTKLKKLIEDLMEASKASTGNLVASPEPCDVRVLLGQCLGEYEERLKNHQLELIVKQCQEPIRIMADPKMLWRVFDNLMSNICKYAQPLTRVYLNTELAGERVLITFKNVSKYALDLSPEDLMERFVRGDLSRHTEGNGLGLSIVKSLMELQKGEITLAVDGDLFKAILAFDVLAQEERPDENEKNG